MAVTQQRIIGLWLCCYPENYFIPSHEGTPYHSHLARPSLK
jgi:hypothetical protein